MAFAPRTKRFGAGAMRLTERVISQKTGKTTRQLKRVKISLNLGSKLSKNAQKMLFTMLSLAPKK
jgi:hypothetical protein